MKATVTEAGFDIIVFLTIFFFTMEGALWAVGILIVSDTITGVWGALKEGGWDAFQSRKLGRIITKLILYPLCLLIAYTAEHILSPNIPWISVTMGALATVEMKSIFENITKILGFKLWQAIKKAVWKDKEPDIPITKEKEN